MVAWKLRDLSGVVKNHTINMVAKQLENFLSTKRPLSVIFKSWPKNEVIRHKHQDHVFAKIMLEQKSDLVKFASDWSTFVLEQQ